MPLAGASPNENRRSRALPDALGGHAGRVRTPDSFGEEQRQRVLLLLPGPGGMTSLPLHAPGFGSGPDEPLSAELRRDLTAWQETYGRDGESWDSDNVQFAAWLQEAHRLAERLRIELPSWDVRVGVGTANGVQSRGVRYKQGSRRY